MYSVHRCDSQEVLHDLNIAVLLLTHIQHAMSRFHEHSRLLPLCGTAGRSCCLAETLAETCDFLNITVHIGATFATGDFRKSSHGTCLWADNALKLGQTHMFATHSLLL